MWEGDPLPQCAKILKSKILKYAFSATLCHFTALLPCFTTILKKLITRQSLSLNYTIGNISRHQLNMLDDKNCYEFLHSTVKCNPGCANYFIHERD